MSGAATPPVIMDPNAIIPSPPSSIYSSTTTATTPPSTTTAPRQASKSAPAGTQLPFPEVLKIMIYTQAELECLCYRVLKTSAPELLEAKDIDCAEQLELNWACRHLPPHCPDNMGPTLNDWLPDIRHAAVHRHRFSALAACKTIAEAAIFATTMGDRALGRSLEIIAREMDWCRAEMDKYHGGDTTSRAKEEVEEEVKARLKGVLKAAKKEREWAVKEGWSVSDEVREYTFERKLEENAWADPRPWGQDLNRQYQSSSYQNNSNATPARLSSGVDQVGRWRPSTSTAASSASGSSTPSTQPAPMAQNKSNAYVPPAKRNGSGSSWGRKK